MRKGPSLRYPIGPFAGALLADVKEAERLSHAPVEQELPDEVARLAAIETISDCPRALREAVSGLTDAQLDTPYRPDGWTSRQLVHHLVDSHMNAYIRFKLALTEQNPTIRPYDEKAWAVLPDAVGGDPEISLRLLDSLHARWALMLGAMQPAEYGRAFYHPEHHSDIYLGNALALYAWHCRHHVAHIVELRIRNHW